MRVTTYKVQSSTLQRQPSPFGDNGSSRQAVARNTPQLITAVRQTSRAEAPRAAVIVDPLLILDAVGGYHVLLAGMEQISVGLWQFVVTGEPVAVMGGRAQLAVAKAGGAIQPVLYVEFRKDG